MRRSGLPGGMGFPSLSAPIWASWMDPLVTARTKVSMSRSLRTCPSRLVLISSGMVAMVTRISLNDQLSDFL